MGKKKAAVIHRNTVAFLSTQVFLRRKISCRSIIIWNTRFIQNSEGQSRFRKPQGRQMESSTDGILTSVLPRNVPYSTLFYRICIHSLELNLQPQGNMSFWKPEENIINSMISYQSRLSLQCANHKPVAIDYGEVRWSRCANVQERHLGKKIPLCSGGISGRNYFFAQICISTTSK